MIQFSQVIKVILLHRNLSLVFGILLHLAKTDDVTVHNNELNFLETPLTAQIYKNAKNTKIDSEVRANAKAQASNQSRASK